MSPVRSTRADPPSPTLRQRLAEQAAGLARALRRPVPAPAVPATPTVSRPDDDPAMAAVGAHRAAFATWKPLGDAWNDAVGSAFRPAEEAQRGPWLVQSKAFEALIRTTPATPTGLRALAAYLPGAVEEANCVQVEEDAREALRSVCRGVLALVDDPGADGELLRLGRQFEAAQAEAARLRAELIQREDASAEGYPERPAGLVFRAEDHAYCLRRVQQHPETLAGSQVTADDLDWMGRGPLTHQVVRDARPGEKGWRDFKGRVPEIVPWPEAQARADELTALYDGWQAAVGRHIEAHGIQEADEAHDAAEVVVMDLCDRIAAMPATTAEGLRIKLRASAHYEEEHDGNYPAGRLLNSLLRDARGAALAVAASEVPEAPEAFDPVLAAIAASHAAEAAMKAFSADPKATSREGWFEREVALSAATTAARDAAWGAVPTTRAGRAALADYAWFQIAIHDPLHCDLEVVVQLLNETVGALTAAIHAETEGR